MKSLRNATSLGLCSYCCCYVLARYYYISHVSGSGVGCRARDRELLPIVLMGDGPLRRFRKPEALPSGKVLPSMCTLDRPDMPSIIFGVCVVCKPRGAVLLSSDKSTRSLSTTEQSASSAHFRVSFRARFPKSFACHIFASGSQSST